MPLSTTSKEDIKANRLVAGTRKWAEMPTSRRAGVKAELARRVTDGEISEEQYKEIMGDELRQPQPRDGTSYSVEDYHYY